MSPLYFIWSIILAIVLPVLPYIYPTEPWSMWCTLAVFVGWIGLIDQVVSYVNQRRKQVEKAPEIVQPSSEALKANLQQVLNLVLRDCKRTDKYGDAIEHGCITSLCLAILADTGQAPKIEYHPTNKQYLGIYSISWSAPYYSAVVNFSLEQSELIFVQVQDKNKILAFGFWPRSRAKEILVGVHPSCRIIPTDPVDHSYLRR